MSATATMLYPAPPPTKNTLDREQRSRLLRSSRKLGAVLGTTPLVVEPETEAETPARTARPHRGYPAGLFQTQSASASSSSSSLSVASSSTAVSNNSDYVFVRSTTRSAPYQVQAIFDNASPSSSRSASPYPGGAPRAAAGVTATSTTATATTTAVSRKRKQGVAGEGHGLAPLFTIPGPAGSKQTRSGASGPNAKLDKVKGATGAGHAHAHSAQPLLLRLRSVPAQTDGINSQLDDHSISPPKPLSPVASTFNMNMSVDMLNPPSPSMNGQHTHGLSDRERRRKMAKLARTLGENIPPELVFGSSASTSNYNNNNNFAGPSSSSTSHASTLTRRASSSAASKLRNANTTDQGLDSFAPFHYHYNKPATQFNPTASLPPLAVAAAPQPPQNYSYHAHDQQEHQQPASHLRPAAQVEKLNKKRLNRPRSLTLGTASAFAAATAMLTRNNSVAPAPALTVAPAPAPIPTPSPKYAPEHITADYNLTRGTTSLDLDSLPSSPRPRATMPSHTRAQTYYAAGGITGFMVDDDAAMPSPRPFIHVAMDATPFDMARSSSSMRGPSMDSNSGTVNSGHGNGESTMLTIGWGRRKEREWSGEWNLKDMEDVAKKLRGLKGR